MILHMFLFVSSYSGAVVRCRRSPRVQVTVTSNASLYDITLLTVQSRVGLAHPCPRHLHGYLHPVRGRVLTQRRVGQR